MGVYTYDSESISSIPPAKLFKALVIDADSIILKAMPQAIKSIQILEGDGGAGTIKLINFGEGSQLKSIKHRTDEIDTEKLVYKYTILEGVGDVVESVSSTLKIEASTDRGSISKYSSTYKTKDEAKLEEAQLKFLFLKFRREKGNAIFKAIEAYLVANPDYN